MEVVCVLHAKHAAEGGEPPEERWECVLRGLEGIGAAIECERLGEAFFAADGLRGLHGGTGGVLAAAREAAGQEVAIASGATRLEALSGARGAPGPPAALPVTALCDRLGVPDREAAGALSAMERLGIATLGALAELPAATVADRFGPVGMRAHLLARGEEEPLRPREAHEELVAELELPEGTAGSRLDRALELLVDRLLASPRRRGRTLLGLRLGAMLVDGRSWSVFQGVGRATASSRVLRTVLGPRLAELPAPALCLRLRAVGVGPPAADQLELAVEGRAPRRRRLGAAVREVREVQGADALLKALPVDEASRFPERRVMLTPFPEL